jgi:hypothetical protein
MVARPRCTYRNLAHAPLPSIFPNLSRKSALEPLGKGLEQEELASVCLDVSCALFEEGKAILPPKRDPLADELVDV